MTLIIIIFLLAICQFFIFAFEYDLPNDSRPGSLFHKAIRKLNKWLASDEIISEDRHTG